MAFGFPAHFSESRAYQYQPHELALATRSALDDLGWRYDDLPNNAFTAKISINAMSWGENFKIQIQPSGLIEAESRCANPLQCFDWGKNKENVLNFFDRFDLMVRTELSK